VFSLPKAAPVRDVIVDEHLSAVWPCAARRVIAGSVL
jgi:hypothetical protein